MNDAPFQKVVTAWIAAEAYRRLRAGSPEESMPEPTDSAITCGDISVVE